MIKNLFLPEKINNYYLFPKRVIGFDIGKTYISATQAYINGKSTTVEKVISQPLPTGVDYTERVVLGIKSILNSMDKYDAIYTALSSSVVVFKDLTLPFTTKEKIALVVPYEVESSLPFSLDNAVIDFIITKTHAEQSDVVVAAVQKHYIAEHLALFEAAGVQAQKILVDLFSLYSFMLQSPEYANAKGAQVIMDIGFSATNLSYIQAGQLKFIRSLPIGISTIVKQISSGINTTAQEAHDTFFKLGFETVDDQKFSQQLGTAFNDYLNQIRFTLQSFETRPQAEPVSSIILLGAGAELKNIAEAMNKTLNIPTHLFAISGSLENIKLKHKMEIPLRAVISFTVALPTPLNETFNLRQHEFSLIDENLFAKQVIIASILVVLIFGLLIGNNIMQVRKLQKAIDKGEKQAVKIVSDTLGITGIRNLNELVDEAQRKVLEQDRIWFAFSQHTRSSFLKSLQKLSTYIDKESIGLNLRKAFFNQEIIRLQGEVKNIAALVIFEDELKQTNLGTFSAAQEPKFDITITLKKNLEEE